MTTPASGTTAHHAFASRRPPRWLPRALTQAVLAVFVGLFVWRALGSLTPLLVNLLIAFFVALAMEPMVVWLVRHGWRRGAATGVVLIGGLLALLGVLALFGGLFVRQLVQLGSAVPELYAKLQDIALERFKMELPESDELVQSAVDHFGSDVAGRLVGVGSSIVGGVFAFTTILLVAFYLSAAGPRFRATICGVLTPNRQNEVLRMWEITQEKVSDFINSRIVLALLSSVFTFAFLSIVKIPYALPLAVFTGVVSQFVPTIGTYIGGAPPVLVALTQGIPQGIATLAFILVYQQIENYFFSPKVSAKALSMNPAVSFVVVLAFGAVFGPLGAFLGLPIAATIQAFSSTYIHRHTLVESHLFSDEPAPAPTDPEPADPGPAGTTTSSGREQSTDQEQSGPRRPGQEP